MNNREKNFRLDGNLPGVSRPLAFPELTRGRTFAQPFNIKVGPRVRQGDGSYDRARMALVGLGVFAAVSAVLIALRIVVWSAG
jgi:hypothetical protein